jgi:hypothetical protein
LEVLAVVMAVRLVQVQNGSVNLATEKLAASGLTPKVVPSWCKDADVSCGAYGVSICQTSEASSICNAYCGCASETTVSDDDDDDDGDGDDDDDDDDDSGLNNAFASKDPKAGSSTTTIVVIIAVVLILAVIGGAMFMSNKSGSNGGDGQANVAFENPMYDAYNQPPTQQQVGAGGGAYTAPAGGEQHYDVASGGTAGYMDVGGVDAGVAATGGYMDVTPTPAAQDQNGWGDSDDEDV